MNNQLHFCSSGRILNKTPQAKPIICQIFLIPVNIYCLLQVFEHNRVRGRSG